MEEEVGHSALCSTIGRKKQKSQVTSSATFNRNEDGIMLRALLVLALEHVYQNRKELQYFYICTVLIGHTSLWLK
jgi:hypothetical protein